MLVKLQNTTKRPRRMLVLSLTKAVAPVRVDNTTVEESADGQRRTRVSKKLVPDSIRVPVDGFSEDLDPVCLTCPQVQKAIAERLVKVVEIPDSEPQANTETATAPTAPQSPRTRRSMKNDNGGNA